MIIHLFPLRDPELIKMCSKSNSRLPADKLVTEYFFNCRSGCDIFRKKQMFLLKDHILNSKERFGRVNKMWLDLSSEEKKRYQEEVFKDNKKYCMELQKWFEV